MRGGERGTDGGEEREHLTFVPLVSIQNNILRGAGWVKECSLTSVTSIFALPGKDVAKQHRAKGVKMLVPRVAMKSLRWGHCGGCVILPSLLLALVAPSPTLPRGFLLAADGASPSPPANVLIFLHNTVLLWFTDDYLTIRRVTRRVNTPRHNTVRRPGVMAFGAN